MLLVKDGDLAQDIFQETFIKVVRFLDEGRYSDSGKFLPWVLRIARNQVIDHFRQAKSEATAGQATSVGAALHQNINLPEQNIEDVIISDQIQADIRAMIEQLPEEQREVVRMRYYYGMSFKEIADQTEVSINTALGRMRYALITMRKKIQKHNII
jgi:RNA polymerase sigma-70 factor (ECF subfamily)